MRSVVIFLAVGGGIALAALADPPLQSSDPPLQRAASHRLTSADPPLSRRVAPPSATGERATSTTNIGVALSPPRHVIVHELHKGRFHRRLGSCPLRLHRTIGRHPLHGRFPHQGWWWWGGHGGFGSLGTYDGPYIVGVDSPVSAYVRGSTRVEAEPPPPVAEPPVIEPPPCDPSAEPECALQQGDYWYALALLRAGAATPEPARERLAALALLGLARYGEAVHALASAYAADPSLSAAPLDLADLLGEAEERLFSLAVRRARRSASPDAWLLVAVLMQGQGRDAAALRLLEKPRAAGIHPDAARALRRALSRGVDP